MTVKNILTSSSLIKCLQSKMALKNYIAKSFFLKSGKRFKRSIAHNNLKLTCNIYHIQVFKLRPFLHIGLRWRHLDIRRRGWGLGGTGGGVWKGEAAGWGNFWVVGRVIEFFFFVVMSCQEWRRRLLLPERVRTSKFCHPSVAGGAQTTLRKSWGGQYVWGGCRGEVGVRSRGEVRVGVFLTT